MWRQTDQEPTFPLLGPIFYREVGLYPPPCVCMGGGVPEVVRSRSQGLGRGTGTAQPLAQ